MIVTLAALKRHLKLGDVSSPLDDADLDLQDKLDAAEMVILTKVGERVLAAEAWQAMVATWDETTAPDVVKLAILIQAAEFYGQRGEEAPAPGAADPSRSALAPAVVRLVNLLRDPVVS
jgi:hypothetical protein